VGLRIALAIALAGCGRLGFGDRGDAAVDTGDAGTDAVVCHANSADYLIAAIGNDQPPFPRPQKFTVNGEVVLDENSRLEWQRTIDVAARGWVDAKTYCDQLAVAGGCWRLPQRIELVSIANYAVPPSPAIDSTAFPNTPAVGFWSATPVVNSTTQAWYVTFADGSTGESPTTTTMPVRCVRSTIAPPTNRYQISATTVVDLATELTWQHVIDPGTYTFNTAATFCANLALDQLTWRIPSIQELETIVDTSATNVAVDPTAFPNTPAGLHWSGTLRSTDSQSGWTVDFGVGIASRPIGNMAPVRCVH